MLFSATLDPNKHCDTRLFAAGVTAQLGSFWRPAPIGPAGRQFADGSRVGCKSGPPHRERSETMTRYAVGGYEEYPVLALRPVGKDQGVDLPQALYIRWRRARAELDAAQQAVLAHIRQTAGGEAVPVELRESKDHPTHEPASDRSWKLS